MQDGTTLAFSLTYLGTLTIAGLMFLGHLIAFTALLAMVACGQGLIASARALLGRKAHTPPHLGRNMSGGGKLRRF